MSKASSFEESMGRLEDVVSSLEAGDLPLDAALERYEEGVALVRTCRGALEGAELRVRRLVETGLEDVPRGEAA